MKRRIGLSLFTVLFLLAAASSSPVSGAGEKERATGDASVMEAVDISIPLPEKGFFSPGAGGSSKPFSGLRQGPGDRAATFRPFTADGEDLVWVIIEAAVDPGESLPENRLDELEASLLSLGGKVDLTYRNLVQAWLPADVVEAVGKWPEVKGIRQVSWVPPTDEESISSSEGADLPFSGDDADDFISNGDPEEVLSPVADSSGMTGEGVSLAGALDWHDAGITGSGVKVAVIDTGFKDYASLLGTEFPSSVTTKFYGSSSDIYGTKKGTACGEIVHDMAPDAYLYLVRPRTVVELGEAVTWLIGQGVKIISCGVTYGLDEGPGNGTGSVNDIVTSAVNQGVMWVSAAGDQALAHWSGVFQDSDKDGIHDFSGGNEADGITLSDMNPVTVTMNWNDARDTSGSDYDLLIYEYESGEFIAGSQREQDGYEGPWESVTFLPSTGKSYGVVINRYRGEGKTIHVSVLTGQGLKYAVSSTSLLIPADNPAALSVGAVAWNNPNTLEATSSRGPSVNGIVKPDLVGPSRVSTRSYGNGAFAGTAAACAHAAGASALLKQANPSWTPARIKTELEGNARDLGSSGKDTLYGSGLLKLPPPANQYRLYFPHCATAGTWETEAGMVNRGSSVVKGVLKAYDNNGNAVSTSRAVTLPAFGRYRVTAGSQFSSPDAIGYLVFRSSSPDVSGYMNFYIAGTYRCTVPAIPESEVNTGDIAIPHIASNGTWWTGISLVNTTSTSKTVTFDFGGGVTKTKTIGPRAHNAFLIRDLFGGTSRPGLQSALIKNAAGIIGYGLFASGSTLAGTALKDDSACTLDFPHIAVTGGWETYLVVQNLSTSSGTLTITSYDANGKSLGSKSKSLPGRGKYLEAASQALPSGTAWCRITATRSVTGTCLASYKGSKYAAFSVTGIGGSNRIFPRLEKSGYTGIVFINPWSASASVTLKAYNDSGTVIATKYLTLGAYAKIVNIADNLFTSSIGNATYVGLSSNRSLVGFQLNQTSDLKYLDTLEGL